MAVLVSLGAVLLSAVPVSAASGQLRAGVLSGVSRSTVTGSGSPGARARTGVIFGGFAILSLSESFSIRPEVYFSTKGSRFRLDPGTVETLAFETSSVQMPLLLQLHTGRGRQLRPHLFGGVSFGRRLGCKVSGRPCHDVEVLTRGSNETGLILGGEVELAGAALGVRYEAGLAPAGEFTWGTEIFDGVLSLTARYSLFSSERE